MPFHSFDSGKSGRKIAHNFFQNRGDAMMPSVVRNLTDRHFYKVVSRNEDGTIWAKRHGKLTVLKRAVQSSTYDRQDNTPRQAWQFLTDDGYHFS
jgi:hypothetical protein